MRAPAPASTTACLSLLFGARGGPCSVEGAQTHTRTATLCAQVEGVEGLPELMLLDLSHNSVATLRPAEQLPQSLRFLKVRRPSLWPTGPKQQGGTCWHAAGRMRGRCVSQVLVALLPRARAAQLEGNPCVRDAADAAAARAAVLRHVPQLRDLDGPLQPLPSAEAGEEGSEEDDAEEEAEEEEEEGEAQLEAGAASGLPALVASEPPLLPEASSQLPAGTASAWQERRDRLGSHLGAGSVTGDEALALARASSSSSALAPRLSGGPALAGGPRPPPSLLDPQQGQGGEPPGAAQREGERHRSRFETRNDAKEREPAETHGVVAASRRGVDAGAGHRVESSDERGAGYVGGAGAGLRGRGHPRAGRLRAPQQHARQRRRCARAAGKWRIRSAAAATRFSHQPAPGRSCEAGKPSCSLARARRSLPRPRSVPARRLPRVPAAPPARPPRPPARSRPAVALPPRRTPGAQSSPPPLPASRETPPQQQPRRLRWRAPPPCPPRPAAQRHCAARLPPCRAAQAAVARST